MKSIILLFTGMLTLSYGIMAIPIIDVSVPLPPDAWTATGADAGGITETGDDSMAKVEWGPMGDKSSLTFFAADPFGASPGFLNFTNEMGSLDTANLRVLYDIQGVESALIELELHFAIDPVGMAGDKKITFLGQTDITPLPVEVDGFLVNIGVLGFFNGMDVIDSFTLPTGVSAALELAGFVTFLPVPEPDTYLILGSLLGIGALANRRRRVEA